MNSKIITKLTVMTTNLSHQFRENPQSKANISSYKSEICISKHRNKQL